MLNFGEEIENLLITELKKKYSRGEIVLEAGVEKSFDGEIIESMESGIHIFRERTAICRRATLVSSPIASAGKEECGVFASVLSRELRDAAQNALGYAPRRILLAGLGNRALAADSQGCLFVDYAIKMSREGLGAELIKLVPMTESESGLDPFSVLSALVGETTPDMVVVVDALVTASDRFLGRTIQMSDAGIIPGSGVGNAKREISSGTLGVYTVAVGVPTVMPVNSMIFDSLEAAGVEEASDKLAEILERNRALYVSPRDVDRLSDNAGFIVAKAVCMMAK